MIYIVTQNARHPWLALSFIISVLASIGFIAIGYFNWPPQFSFSWIIGTLITIGISIGTIIYGIRLFYAEPYRFELDNDEILIRDWGVLRPRVRKFLASSVTEICHSSEGSSYLTTKDGNIHYIDDVLMLKYRDIF